MKDGIAFDNDVLKRFMEKTGMTERQAKENIKYIHQRLREFMDEETTHSVRMNGLCTANENYMMLRHKTYTGIHPKFKAFLLRKMDNLKKLIDSADKEFTVHYIRRPPFLYRRKYEMTDRELEDKQNEQE